MWNRLLLKAASIMVVVLLITSCISERTYTRQERRYWQWVQEHDVEYYEYVVDSLIEQL